MSCQKICILGIIAILCLGLVTEAGANSSLQQDLTGSQFQARIPFAGHIIFQSNFDGDNEIYCLSQAGLIKLTDNTWEDEYPVWSPDGKKIAYTADPKGNYDLFIMKTDGSEISPITTFSSQEKEPAWFPDGNNIVYSREKKTLGRTSIALYNIDINTLKIKK